MFAIYGVGFTVMALLAMVAPPSWAGAPGFAYLLLPVLMPSWGAVSERRVRRLLAQREGEA